MPVPVVPVPSAAIVAVRLLEAVSAGADSFGPLKSVASGALHFAKLIEVCVLQSMSNAVSIGHRQRYRITIRTRKIGNLSSFM